jgi:DMSO/TMAO reductase YedYZ molybdopterin-dependent catalytic subunit
MSEESALPPGQYASDRFPRFGLTQFARRFPKDARNVALRIDGDVREAIAVSAALLALPRVSQTSDFHCVTTWSRRSLHWSGFRFADFFERIAVPLAGPDKDATFVVLRCQDGYRSCLPLEDLLADDVLLADTLEGAPLTIEHGAPLRLVAPAHFGYKSAKHVSRVEFWRDDRRYRPAGLRFMEHPRARVALEERGRGVPGLVLRYLYRPLVRPTISRFRRAMDEYKRGQPSPD